MSLNVGKFKTISGEVQAINEAGESRVVQAGDIINKDEVVYVVGDNGQVLRAVLEFKDGIGIALTGDTEMKIDQSVYSRVPVAETESVTDEYAVAEVGDIDLNAINPTGAGQALKTAYVEIPSFDAKHTEKEGDSSLSESETEASFANNEVEISDSRPIPNFNDVTPPDAPIFSMTALSDTGVSHSDGITSNVTPTFSGVTEGYATIHLRIDGVFVGKYVTGKSGVWSISAEGLTDGVHTVTATATDFSDNESEPSTVSITIDTTNPDIIVNSNYEYAENGTAAVFHVDATDATDVTYTLAGADANLFFLDANGDVSFINPPNYENAQDSGKNSVYDISVVATDAAGNVSSKDVTVSVTDVNEGIVVVDPAFSTQDEDTTQTGTFTFIDPDWNDNHKVTLIVGDVSNAGYGTLTASVTTETPDWFISFDSEGVVTWIYTPNDSADALISGETATETFEVTLSDSAGNTATKTITVTLVGTNDAAVITVTDTSISEGTAFISGTATHTDVDSNNSDNVFQELSGSGIYGSYTVTAAGVWTYTLDNSLAAIDQLGTDDTLNDTVVVTAEDGTTQNINITINGVNDAAVITVNDAAIAEGDSVVGGLASLTDVDSKDPKDTFTKEDNGVAAYGTYTVTKDGLWEYTLDNTNPDVDGLNVGETLTDTIIITAKDGTTENVLITINGTDDQAVISAADVNTNEDAVSITNIATVSDVDNTAPLFVVATGVATYGSYTIASDGTWTYTLNSALDSLALNESVEDSITLTTTDGVAENMLITITGSNDAPIIEPVVSQSLDEDTVITGTMTSTDIDNGSTVTYSSSAVDGFSINANSGDYTFDAGHASYQGLTIGDVQTVTVSVTADDGLGGTDTTDLVFDVSGTSDATTYILSGTNDVLDLSAVSLDNNNVIDMSDTQSQTVSNIAFDDVLQSDTNTLLIEGGSEDSVTGLTDNGWTQVVSDTTGYSEYNQSNAGVTATLYVDDQIVQS